MVKKNMKHPAGSLKETDLKKDLAKQTLVPITNKVMKVKEANEWVEDAKKQPIPLKLIDCLCYQGENVILFADSNLGKSILAVQIADSLTKAKTINPFGSNNEKLKVLYCDFEMSEKQFENRYSNNYSMHYEFSPNLFRAQLDMKKYLGDMKKPVDVQICDEIQELIITHDIDVIIIDNITYIAQDMEKANAIRPLLQRLSLTNKEYNTTMIVLAHTPKRDSLRPITMNDLAGSKALSNFADSIIAIGKSSVDEELRYIKQVKTRNAEIKYDASNIPLFTLNKNHNFLQFEFVKFDEEQNHLRIVSREELAEIDQLIIAEHQANSELSFQKISDKLGTNKMRVKRVLDKHNSKS